MPCKTQPPGLILLDCDDVLLDFLPGFRKFLEGSGYRLPPGGPGSFDLAPWIGVAGVEAGRLIRRFNDGADSGFSDLSPIPGAVSGIQALRAAGAVIRVISSFSDCPKSLARRADNLERVFGAQAFEGIDAIPLGSSKAAALRRHPPSPFVDDLLENLRAGRDARHRPVLFAAHHNARSVTSLQASGEFPVANDWPHLLEHLDRDLGLAPRDSCRSSPHAPELPVDNHPEPCP